MSERSGGSNGGSSGSSGGTSSNREVAYRLFAAECNDASHSYSESDEERAPNYVVTPTGARVNRLFVIGVLTEVTQAGDSMLRARIADPTGAFVVYAGQYQPDAMAFLDGMEPPAFVAVTGKARTFQPEDSDIVYTSIRPEEMNEVDSNTRDRWTVSTAKRTLERIATIAAALDTRQTGEELHSTLRESGINPSLAAGIPIAIEYYDTTAAYLADVQRLALDATRLVAGEIDTVDSLGLPPDQGDGTIEPALDVDELSVVTEDKSKSEPEPDIPEQTPAESDSEPSVSAEDRTTTTTEHEQTDQSSAQPTEEPTDESTDTDSEIEAETDTDRVTADATTEEVDEFDAEEYDPEEFELDEETRREVEEEYGTEFSTAAEVDAPGEAGIETSEPDVSDVTESNESDLEPSETQTEAEPTFEDLSNESDIDEETTADVASTSDAGPESETESKTVETDTESELESEPEPEPESELESKSEPESDEERDIESLLLDLMHDLDDGDGADREELTEQVSESAGVSTEVVDDTIQDALMSGKCYEPNGGKLKPI